MALSASELAQIQADWQAAAMDTTCTISRGAETTGTWGQTIENFTPVATNVPCYVQAPAGTLLMVQAGDIFIGTRNTWVVQVPIGTDVRANDAITVQGQVLRVQSVDTPRSYPFNVEFTCEAIQ